MIKNFDHQADAISITRVPVSIGSVMKKIASVAIAPEFGRPF